MSFLLRRSAKGAPSFYPLPSRVRRNFFSNSSGNLKPSRLATPGQPFGNHERNRCWDRHGETFAEKTFSAS